MAFNHTLRFSASPAERRRRFAACRRNTQRDKNDDERLRRGSMEKCSVTRINPATGDPQNSLLPGRTGGNQVLVVNIHRAVNLPSPAAADSGVVGSYHVIAWVEPGEEYSTQIAVGMNPEWDERICIPLTGSQTFLHLEVIRMRSYSDPGSSSGRKLVGRTRIPLPDEPWVATFGHHELVRLVGDGHTPEGRINVAMKLVLV